MRERLGRYRIEGVLGTGAMGIVYKAYDPLVARMVALKTIRRDLPDDQPRQQLASRFLHEARAAGRLGHPNIVALHDYAEDGGVAYIVMEYADGVGLDHLLRQRLPRHLPKTIDWMRQLLQALHHAHCRDVIHRDLKPANLIITATGQVKLIDFGVARIDGAQTTHAGSMIGTPCYMSPEQCRGEPVDDRSDLFSVGILLYQLLTGERPFTGSASMITNQILTQPARRPSDLDPSLDPRFDQLISRALAKHPDERFASALEFLAVLQALADTAQDDERTRLRTAP